VGDTAFTPVPEHVGAKEAGLEGDDGVYRWRRQLSAPLTAVRERRCRRTADRIVALSEHGEPARPADREKPRYRPFSARADHEPMRSQGRTRYTNTFHALRI